MTNDSKASPIWNARLAGIADHGLLSFGGYYLGRPISGAAAKIPHTIDVIDGRLVWSEQGEVREVETEELLDAFLRLAQTPDDGILEFAKRYGPLRLCARHGVLECHRPMGTWGTTTDPIASTDEIMNFDYASTWCRAKIESDSPRRYSEPLSLWRRHAQEARDLLEIASKLRHLEKHAPNRVEAAVDISQYVSSVAEKWKQLDGVDLADPAYNHESWSWMHNPWLRLAENLNRWLRISDVEVFVTLRKREPRITLGSHRWMSSVFSLIALELVSVVAGASGLAVCSNCALPYLLNRSAAEGKRTYCPDCRAKGIPVRDAARDRRARIRRKVGK